MKNQDKEIICLHCYEKCNTSEHRCLWELFDNLIEEIAELKEHNCGNSGWNFQQYMKNMKEEIMLAKKLNK